MTSHSTARYDAPVPSLCGYRVQLKHLSNFLWGQCTSYVLLVAEY